MIRDSKQLAAPAGTEREVESVCAHVYTEEHKLRISTCACHSLQREKPLALAVDRHRVHEPEK